MRHHWNEFVSESTATDGGFTSTGDEQRARALAEEMNEHATRASRGGEEVLAAPVASPRLRFGFAFELEDEELVRGTGSSQTEEKAA